MSQRWFVARDRTISGPFSSTELQAHVSSGELRPQDLLMLDGQKDWVKAVSVKELFPPVATATISAVSSSDPPLAKPAVAAPHSSSSGSRVLLRRLVGFGPLPLVFVCGGLAAVWLIWLSAPEAGREAATAERLTNSEPRDKAAASQRLTSPEPRREPATAKRPISPQPQRKVSVANRPTNPQPRREVAARPRGPVAAAAPKETPRPASASDLSDLARLLSHDVIAGPKEYRRPADAEWIAAVKKLRSSSDPAVAAAVAALMAPEGGVSARAFAVALGLKVGAENRARMKGIVEKNLGGILNSLESWADDETLRDPQTRHGMSPDEIDAYREARDRAQAKSNKAWMDFLGPVLQSAAHQKIADDQIRRIRKIAEVIESYVFVEHLVPVLRARAGAKIEAAPLDLKLGMVEDRNDIYGNLGLACGSTNAKRELTNLTLLLTIRGAGGARYVAVFLPRLGPSYHFRLLPFACGAREILASASKKPSLGSESAGRYSLWCDQFRLEDQELTPAAYKKGNLAYAAQAALPQACYFSDLPPARNMNYRTDLVHAQRFGGTLPKPEFYCRYSLTFTDLKPQGDGYQVRARLDRYDVDDKSKLVGSTNYAGTIHNRPAPPPPVGNRKPLPAELFRYDLVCQMEGDGHKLQLHIRIPASGELRWDTDGDDPLKNRDWVSAEQTKKTDDVLAEYKKKNDILNTARGLAMQGKKQEATKVLNNFIAASPGPKWESWAREMLNDLDQIEQSGRQRMQRRQDRLSLSRNNILEGARNLAKEGKKKEAEKVLNDFIASAPGEKWEGEAREVLMKLDDLAKEGAAHRQRLREWDQKRREEQLRQIEADRERERQKQKAGNK